MRLLLTLLLLHFQVKAQDTASANFFIPSEEYSPERGKLVKLGAAGLYTASITGLYYVWYKDDPATSFHFFDDYPEWLGMDKAGHVATAYIIGNAGYHSMKWAGFNEESSLWLGGGVGFIFLTTVEVYDGFSPKWGFSLSDMAANAIGSMVFIGQQKFWNQQKFHFKFSYHHTEYAAMRPNLLGKGNERILKDYNGQTYWLSGNISSFFPMEKYRWLNLSFGYGANGMISGRKNFANDEIIDFSIERYKQFYFSIDPDLTRINLKPGFLRTFLHTINFIKFPAPAIEINQGGKTKFYWLFF